jgi:hypothetical protein
MSVLLPSADDIVENGQSSPIVRTKQCMHHFLKLSDNVGITSAKLQRYLRDPTRIQWLHLHVAPFGCLTGEIQLHPNLQSTPFRLSVFVTADPFTARFLSIRRDIFWDYYVP